MKCNKCGHDNDETSKFCVKCGTQLEKKPKYCPRCGAELSDSALFCPKCGEKISTSVNKKGNSKLPVIVCCAAAAIALIIGAVFLLRSDDKPSTNNLAEISDKDSPSKSVGMSGSAEDKTDSRSMSSSVNPNNLAFTIIKDSIGRRLVNRDTMYVAAAVAKPTSGPKYLVDAIADWEKQVIGGEKNMSLESSVNKYVNDSWKELSEYAPLDETNADMIFGRYRMTLKIAIAYENPMIVTFKGEEYMLDGGAHASLDQIFHMTFDKRNGRKAGLDLFKKGSWSNIKPLMQKSLRANNAYSEKAIQSIPEPYGLFIADGNVYFEYSSIQDIDPDFVGFEYIVGGVNIPIPIEDLKEFFVDGWK